MAAGCKDGEEDHDVGMVRRGKCQLWSEGLFKLWVTVRMHAIINMSQCISKRKLYNYVSE